MSPERLSTDDAAGAIHVLADAFAGYPVMGYASD